MLTLAFALLAAAVLLGAVLAVLHLRETKPPPAVLGAVHGVLALGGFACLLLALGGPPRGLATGTAGFGRVAAVLIALAALAGGGILAARLRRKPLAGALIGSHATLAVGGFVVLAAYLFAG